VLHAILAPLKQELKNLPPFFGMRMTRVLPPCVETGHTEFENHAHHLNLKLVRMTHSEIETFRSLKEKMKMASFFGCPVPFLRHEASFLDRPIRTHGRSFLDALSRITT
jgi:hypothetical protein